MLKIALAATLVIAPLAFAQPTETQPQAQPQAEPQARPPIPPLREDLPTGESLFAKHVEAIGGEQAILAHKNILRRGSIRGDKSFALLTSWHEGPDKIRTRYEPPGKPTIDTIFVDGYGWKVIDAKRAELVRNEELRQLRDDADFFADIEPTRRYEALRTTRILENEETGSKAYEVWVRFPYGKVELHYFDVDTGLRITTISSTTTPEGQIPLSISYRDYRDVSGVQMPFELTVATNMGEENEHASVVKFSEIKANVQSVPSWEMPPVVAQRIAQLEAAAKENPGG